MRFWRAVAGACLLFSMVSASEAQTGATDPVITPGNGLRDRIRELFSFGTCGRPLCLDNSVNATNGHGDHFIPDIAANNGAILAFLTDAIATSAAILPLSAASFMTSSLASVAANASSTRAAASGALAAARSRIEGPDTTEPSVRVYLPFQIAAIPTSS